MALPPLLDDLVFADLADASLASPSPSAPTDQPPTSLRAQVFRERLITVGVEQAPGQHRAPATIAEQP